MDTPANSTLLEISIAAVMSPNSANAHSGPLVQSLLSVNASNTLLLTAHVMVERRKPDSFFKEYLATLPEKFDLPFLWSPEELEELRGTKLMQSVLVQKQAAEEEFKMLSPVLEQHAAELPEGVNSNELYLWALGAVLSRSFMVAVGETPVPILIPGADIFNVDVEGAALDLEAEDSVVRVQSQQGYKAGDQIFLGAGKQGNVNLMAMQGFALPYNPNDSVNLYVSLPKNDPFTEMRRSIMSYAGINPEMGYPIGRGGKLDQSLLQALRISTLQPSEFDKYKMVTAEDTYVSLENEMAAFRQVINACQQFLASFATTGEEDDKLLMDPEGVQRRKAWALVYRRGEKAIYSEVLQTISNRWGLYLFDGLAMGK